MRELTVYEEGPPGLEIRVNLETSEIEGLKILESTEIPPLPGEHPTEEELYIHPETISLSGKYPTEVGKYKP